MEPLVSIIIRTKDRPEDLMECLTAVLSQDYPDFEVIVVDDHSKVPVILFSSLSRTTPVKPVQQVESLGKGMSAALNTGLKHAKGKIIAVVDDDSIPEETWLSKSVDALEDGLGEIDAVGTAYTPTINKVFYAIGHLKEEIDLLFLKQVYGFRLKPVMGGTTVIYKMVVDDVGLMDETLKKGVDQDYGIRFAMKGYKKGEVNARVIHKAHTFKRLESYGYRQRGFEFTRSLLNRIKLDTAKKRFFFSLWILNNFKAHVVLSLIRLDLGFLRITSGNIDAMILNTIK